MPNFEYTGQLPSGAAITGTLEAPGPGDARRRLDDLDVHVMSIAPAAGIPFARPLSRDDLLFFNQQLASLAETGIALDQGLRVIARDLRRGRLKTAVEGLAIALENGIPLDQAVRRQGGLFPPLYAEVLQAGAANGRLGSTLCNLNTHLTLMDAGRRLFWESATYPIVILTLGFALTTFFLLRIVPQFEAMYADLGIVDDFNTGQGMFGDQPFHLMGHLTRALFVMARNWPWVALSVIAGVIAGVTLFRALRWSEVGRRLRERLILAMPGIGRVYRLSLLARFAQAAALGARAGQSLSNVLRLSAGATGSHLLARDADRLSRYVEAGGSPIEASVVTSLMPGIVGYTVQIAGARGQLAEALADMARGWDDLARYRLAMFRLILIPFLILLTALVIGAGIIALFMPLLTTLNALTSF